MKKEFLRFRAGMKQLVGYEGLATKTGNTIGRIGLEGNQRFGFGLSGNEVPVIPPGGSYKTVKSILWSTWPNVTLHERGGNRT